MVVVVCVCVWYGGGGGGGVCVCVVWWWWWWWWSVCVCLPVCVGTLRMKEGRCRHLYLCMWCVMVHSRTLHSTVVDAANPCSTKQWFVSDN